MCHWATAWQHLTSSILPSLAAACLPKPTLDDQSAKRPYCKAYNLCTAQEVFGCSNAPLPADGDIDGALEQMSSFANQSAQTTADEELYSSSLGGQHGVPLSPRGQDKGPTSPQVLPAACCERNSVHCNSMWKLL